MAKIITYHLKDGEDNSDGYYLEADRFATEWLKNSVPQLRKLINGYEEFRRQKNLPNRSTDACAFELLVLGVSLLALLTRILSVGVKADQDSEGEE